MHFVKTSKPAPRESRGRAQGRGRTEMCGPRGFTGTQGESRSPGLRDTLPPVAGCRADGCRPRVVRTGRKPCKTSGGFCTRAASNQAGKTSVAPLFCLFPHSRGFLCGKKFSSLRQERNFFQQRNPVFAARKRPPRRKNAPYKQFLHPFFNNSPPISALPPRHRDAASSGKTFVLTVFHGIWRHSVIFRRLRRQAVGHQHGAVVGAVGMPAFFGASRIFSARNGHASRFFH